MPSPTPARLLALAALAALATRAARPAPALAQTRPARPASSPGIPVTKSVTPPVGQIADTERAFAQAVRERGFRDAFLAYMADEGMLFQPGPITARVWLVTNPPPPGTLAWEPAWGAASAAGDIGFTTGPYTHRVAEGDSGATHGQYVTVWLRQEEGNYRALLDIGVPGPATTPGAFVPRALAPVAARPAGGATRAGIAEAARATLFIADRGLAAAGRAEGPGAALAAVAASDVRILRADRPPIVGRDSLLAALAPAPGAPATTWAWQTQDARLARSGDLGVTHGSYDVRDAGGTITERGHYVRVWAREAGGWRVLLDLAAPAR